MAKLGPGLVTGAADDDPSGIGTYSIAGARFGYSTLWTAWFTFPLMAAIQLTCARMSIATGRGLAELIRTRYGAKVLWPACFLLAVANITNIGADLGAMAASTSMLSGIPAWLLTPVYAALLMSLLIWVSYRRLARTLKWLTVVLFTYLVAAFFAHPDWSEVLKSTFLPHYDSSRDYIEILVALLGTTISPYLFFWQSNQEVEERRDAGKVVPMRQRRVSPPQDRDARIDVLTGTFFSNLIMYFIVLTTGATLHARNHGEISTIEQAAQALRPVAGHAAFLLFTLGIVGTGMLSIPVLAGATSYALTEAAGKRGSLALPPRRARYFYAVIAASFLLGLALNYLGVGVVAMLFWSAVINGILAPPLIVLVARMSSDPAVMGTHVSGPVLRSLSWLTAAIMGFAAIAMFAV